MMHADEGDDVLDQEAPPSVLVYTPSVHEAAASRNPSAEDAIPPQIKPGPSGAVVLFHEAPPLVLR